MMTRTITGFLLPTYAVSAYVFPSLYFFLFPRPTGIVTFLWSTISDVFLIVGIARGKRVNLYIDSFTLRTVPSGFIVRCLNPIELKTIGAFKIGQNIDSTAA